MLTHLAIRNYAIADQLDIDFHAGMTAITGESGAGKSIILGALGLVLGDRADRDVVSEGSEKADISAEFDLGGLPLARQWLTDNALTAESDEAVCLLRRNVSADGRSRAWVNHTPVTLQALSALGNLLMDIHSQHEHHSLLKKATHQILLDDFGGNRELAIALHRITEQWKNIHRQLETLRELSDTRVAQHELAQYQLNELDELNLAPGELQNLDEELDQLSNAEGRLGNLQALVQLCREGDETTIVQCLQQAMQLIHEAGGDTVYRDVTEMLNTALIQVEEATDELNRHLDKIEINPVRLSEVNERLASIHQMARKHKVRPEELEELRHSLSDQIAAVQSDAEQISRLTSEEIELRAQWRKTAQGLSNKRKQAAAALSSAVNEQLTALGMADARLQTELQTVGTEMPQSSGLEHVEFLISTNPGLPPKSLARIASGGELSRISLAIQVITAMTSATPCMVFDEVDVGIGGSVARTVGKLLRQLGSRCQVLCVTHQALVASLANHHFFVSKKANGDRVQTQISPLDETGRLQEVARMLGGEADGTGLSAQSLAHARELTAGV